MSRRACQVVERLCVSNLPLNSCEFHSMTLENLSLLAQKGA